MYPVSEWKLYKNRMNHLVTKRMHECGEMVWVSATGEGFTDHGSYIYVGREIVLVKK